MLSDRTSLNTSRKRYLEQRHIPLIVLNANLAKFDQRKGATWHCIVGKNFGSFVTHGKLEIAPGCMGRC